MLIKPNPREFAAALEEVLPAAPSEALSTLADYLATVEQYRRVLNITAFEGAELLARELVGEAARLLQLGPIEPGWQVLDLGSGVGTPVIPLAVLSPQASFAGIEARERRAVFLQQVKARLRIANLDFMRIRVEDLALDHALAYDLITARAFAQPPELLRLALPLLKPGGELRGYLSGVQTLPLELLDQHGVYVASTIDYSMSGGLSDRVVYSLRRTLAEPETA